MLLDSTSDAVAALKADRGVAFAEDSTLLLGLTLKDPSLKVVGDDKAETPWGIGIKQGDQAAKQYVDAVLADLQAKDTFWEIFGSVVTDAESSRRVREEHATTRPEHRLHRRRHSHGLLMTSTTALR